MFQEKFDAEVQSYKARLETFRQQCKRLRPIYDLFEEAIEELPQLEMRYQFGEVPYLSIPANIDASFFQRAGLIIDWFETRGYKCQSSRDVGSSASAWREFQFGLFTVDVWASSECSIEYDLTEQPAYRIKQIRCPESLPAA